jgi:short-subunit dehydrogenase
VSDAAAQFRERYGPWAVIAGASAGLGAAWARAIAARGVNPVLVARRQEQLGELARELADRYAVRPEVMTLDLSRPDAAVRLLDRTAGLDVGLLVYNAAFSLIGPFLEQPLDQHLLEVEVNIRAPLVLAHTLGRRMAERGRGGVVLMSSLSAAHGSPRIANYAATKAWNLVLAEGLWYELAGRGVNVLGCAAGATDTPNYRASTPRRPGLMPVSVLSPEAVVEAAIATLGRSPSVIPGRANRLTAAIMQRILGRRATVRLMGRTMDRMYGSPGDA